MVGFDEQDRVEQFVFSKTTSLPTKPLVLTEGEQQALLDEFSRGSPWKFAGNDGNGPLWARADGQAYASYIADQRWLVVMNAAGRERSTRALPLNRAQGPVSATPGTSSEHLQLAAPP